MQEKSLFIFGSKKLSYLRMSGSREKPVRIRQAHKTTVEKIAGATGVTYQEVIGWAIDALGDYYEHHGKRLLLPLRFTETFRVYQMNPSLEVRPGVKPAPPKSVR
jgi:hypothetical protein